MKNSQLSSFNKKYTYAIAVLPAAAGSAVTFMFVFAALAGLWNIVQKGITLKLNKYDRIVVYPAFAFFIVNALSIIRFDFEFHDLASLVPSSLFLLLYFFIKRYRYVEQENYFVVFLNAAPFGAFLLLPWVVYEVFYLDMRMAGGAGNAIPFGMICALMIPICLMNLLSKSMFRKSVSMIGFAIFSFGLAFSLSRSMYIAAVPNILIAFGYLIYESREKLKVLIFAMLTLFVLVVLVLSSSTVTGRFLKLVDPFTSILVGTQVQDKSVDHRYGLLKKGVCFAENNILLGYGISNRREVLLSEEIQPSSYFAFCRKIHGVYQYSHFHNGFLTAFIDAGLIGLLVSLAVLFSPLVLAVFSPNDRIKSQRITVALCVTSVYTMAGFTNLLFGHDLIDAIFLIFSGYLALSIEKNLSV